MIDISKFKAGLDGKPAYVFGLGISNLAAIEALISGGVAVDAWDDDDASREKALEAGAGLIDYTDADFDISRYSCMVLAPGVPLTKPKPHPVVDAANSAGIEIICDIEILHRCAHGRKVVGITGTNGKSTTTALIEHILRQCGKDVEVGGNIGKSALSMNLPEEGGTILLEVSSFQMELCPDFLPDIAVHLNLSPDHLDRHGTMEDYMKAKKRMFAGKGDAVICAEDEYSKMLLAIVKTENARNIIEISGGSREAALEVAKFLDCNESHVLRAIENFKGLPHRQFLVRTIGKIDYINDSKATNVAAAANALSVFKNIYWIAGGQQKEGGFDYLNSYLSEVREVFLIGKSMREFGKWLDMHGIKYSYCWSLDKAVIDAGFAAQNEGGHATILLSPACASFDQFSSFEERGGLFSKIVMDLREEAA
jgi:UDP-N-acetylmuramoylalanine--D-glutamate ligase